KEHDIVRRQNQAMIGRRPGERRRALDGVEAIHPGSRSSLIRGILSPRGKLTSKTHLVWPPGEKIRVERQDNIGFRQVVNRLEWLIESEPRPLTNGIARHRFVTVPFRVRELLEQALKLAREHGRSDRRCQET